MKKTDDEEIFVLTEQACMQETLRDFGIHVSLPMAKAIMENFMELMVRSGHIARREDES